MAPVNVMYLEAMSVVVNVIVCRWKMCRDASMCCGEGVGAMAAYYCLAVASVLGLGCVE